MSGAPTTAEALAQLGTEVDTFYVLWAGTLVFLMQLGFAMLSAGSVRAKNVVNIALKSLLDACIGALAWYLVGYGFAYDADACVGGAPACPEGAYAGNGFIGGGKTNFAMSAFYDWDRDTLGQEWIGWFFQYAFAAAAATIVSGAVAERCQLSAYLAYTCGLTGFVYPVVVHWVWDTPGFLHVGNPDAIIVGVVDFAGSGVVHMTGGIAAIVGAKILGPRRGRFGTDGGAPAGNYSGHSVVLQVLGTFLLWFGWYGFNCGSTLALQGSANVAARVAVTTTLSGATAAVAGLLLKTYLPPKLGGSGVYDLTHTCNSLLAGLVSITAGCAVVAPYAAIVIGIIGAIVYHAASCMMRQLKIDDPLDAFAVHGASGMWGVFAVGWFATCSYTTTNVIDGDMDCGVFYGGNGMLLASQLVFIIIGALWVAFWTTLLFLGLKAAGILRVSTEVEEAGIDVSKHGGSAYPEQMKNSVDTAAA